MAEFLADQTAESSDDAEDVEVVSDILKNIVAAGSGDPEVRTKKICAIRPLPRCFKVRPQVKERYDMVVPQTCILFSNLLCRPFNLIL